MPAAPPPTHYPTLIKKFFNSPFVVTFLGGLLVIYIQQQHSNSIREENQKTQAFQEKNIKKENRQREHEARRAEQSTLKIALLKEASRSIPTDIFHQAILQRRLLRLCCIRDCIFLDGDKSTFPPSYNELKAKSKNIEHLRLSTGKLYSEAWTELSELILNARGKENISSLLTQISHTYQSKKVINSSEKLKNTLNLLYQYTPEYKEINSKNLTTPIDKICEEGISKIKMHRDTLNLLTETLLLEMTKEVSTPHKP